MPSKIPQDAEKEQLRGSPNIRVKTGKAPQLDKTFLSTASKGLDAENKALAKKKRDQEDFLKAKARNEFRILRARSEAQVSVSQGADTLVKAEQERKKFLEAKDSYLQNIPEDYRGAVSGEIDSQRVNLEETIIPKQFQEVKKLKDQTYAADVKGFQDEAIIKSHNLEEFEKGLGSLRQSAFQRAVKKYGENVEAITSEGVSVNQVIQQASDAVVSDTVQKAIQYQAEFGAVAEANNLFEKYKDSLTPADSLKARKSLENANRQNRVTNAVALADKAFSDYPVDEAAQEKYIRENSPDGETYKESMLFIRNRNSITESKRKSDKRKALANAYITAEDVYIKNKRPVDAEFLKSIPPEHKASVMEYIRKRSRNEAIISDRDERERLIQLYRNNPEKFIDETEDIMRFANKLDRDDMRTIEQLRNNQISREETQENRIRNLTERSFFDIIARFKKEERLSSTQETELQKRVLGWVQELQGRDGITEIEMRKKIYDQLKLNLKQKYEEGTFWDTEAELTEESVTPVQLPPAHRSVISAIRERKPDISDQELKDKLIELDKRLKERGRSIMQPLNIKR